MYDFNQKAAILAVRYATEVKPGDEVLIRGSSIAADLMKAISIEVLKAGGNPYLRPSTPGASTDFFKYGNEKQLQYTSNWEIEMYKSIDVSIHILADTNRQSMALIPPEKLKIYQTGEGLQKIRKILTDREATDDYRWTIVPYPCDALAQDAKMDTVSYTEFVYRALKLGESDPAAYWRGVEKEQDRLVKILEQREEIQVLGEDTDLTFSVKNRRWYNSCGHKNLPDGEVATSPVEDSINGKIRFTFPGIYQGKEIEDIFLEFKDGRVIHGTAKKGQELLDTILTIKNADKIGEFAIGTNYGVTKFTKSILFDEKMGGTIHMALGKGFTFTDSENLDCAIHWDILKNMKTEDSQILADGKIIYKAGKWLI